MRATYLVLVNDGDVLAASLFQQFAHTVFGKSRIARFNCQEKSVIGYATESRIADTLGRFVEGGGARILRSHGVNLVTGRGPHHRVRSFPPGVVTKCTSASGTAVFISDIAIIGRNRTKSRKSEVKIPSVPMYVQMSTHVGINRPHDDGIKSRCNPPTMMMKRSNHMPALTHMQTK